MQCPYCHAEMQKGSIQGAGSRPVIWTPDRPSDVWEKMERLIGGKGQLEASQYNPLGCFRMEAHYCEHCQKMIFDTKITQ